MPWKKKHTDPVGGLPRSIFGRMTALDLPRIEYVYRTYTFAEARPEFSESCRSCGFHVCNCEGE